MEVGLYCGRGEDREVGRVVEYRGVGHDRYGHGWVREGEPRRDLRVGHEVYLSEPRSVESDATHRVEELIAIPVPVRAAGVIGGIRGVWRGYNAVVLCF